MGLFDFLKPKASDESRAPGGIGEGVIAGIKGGLGFNLKSRVAEPLLQSREPEAPTERPSLMTKRREEPEQAKAKEPTQSLERQDPKTTVDMFNFLAPKDQVLTQDEQNFQNQEFVNNLPVTNRVNERDELATELLESSNQANQEALALDSAITPEQRDNIFLKAWNRARRTHDLASEGLIGSFGSIMSGVEWAAGELGADTLSDFAGKSAEGFKIWRKAIELEGDRSFIDDLSVGAGSSLMFFIPGMGAMKGASMFTRISPRIAMIFGSTASTAMESMAEAGDVFQTGRDMGLSEEEAGDAATKDFWINAIVIQATNLIGPFNPAKSSLLRRALWSAPSESVQEFAQAVASNFALESDEAKNAPAGSRIQELTRGAWRAGGIGGILGPVMGGVIGATALVPEGKSPETLTASDKIEDYILNSELTGDKLKSETRLDEKAELGTEGVPAPEQPDIDISKELTGQETQPVAKIRKISRTRARKVARDIIVEQQDVFEDQGSLAEFGPEFESAEQNAALATELIGNPGIRGLLQKTTGKKGFSILEGLDSAGLHNLIKNAIDNVQQGSPIFESLQNIQKRLKDDVDDTHFANSLNRAVGEKTGDIKGTQQRFTTEELVDKVNEMVKDGRLALTDEIDVGVTAQSLLAKLKEPVPQKAKVAQKAKVTPKKTGTLMSRLSNKKTQGTRDLEAELNLTPDVERAITRFEDSFEKELDASREMTRRHLKEAIAEADTLPSGALKDKLIAGLRSLEAKGKISTPIQARLQKAKVLERQNRQVKQKNRELITQLRKSRRAEMVKDVKQFRAQKKNLPAAIQRQMNRLLENYRTTMPFAEMELVVNQLENLKEIGTSMNQIRVAKREKLIKKTTEEMLSGDPIKRTTSQTKGAKDIQKGMMEIGSVDVIIESMDEKGKVWDTAKKPVDLGHSLAREQEHNWDLEIENKIKELGLDFDAETRVMIHGLYHRGGAIGEANRTNLERQGMLEKRGDEFVPPALTSKELEFYNFMRDFFDNKIFPQVQETHDDVSPLEILDKDENYWPVKYTGGKDVVPKGSIGFAIKEVPSGFTKSAKGAEGLDLDVGPTVVFEHIKDTANYIHMAEPMDIIGETILQKEVISALGNANVDYLQNEYIELTSLHGSFKGKTPGLASFLNTMGRPLYQGVLLANIGTSVKQLLSIPLSAARIFADYGLIESSKFLLQVAKNSPVIFHKKLVKNLYDYVQNENPELRAQIGIIDLVQLEGKSQRNRGIKTPIERLPKVEKFLNSLIVNPDMLGRATMTQHLHEMFKNKFNMSNEDAMAHANNIVRQTHGSIFAKDRPTILGRTGARPWFHFQTTLLYMSSVYRNAWTQGFRSANKYRKGEITTAQFTKQVRKSGIVIGGYSIASLAEDFISTLNIDDDDRREEEQAKIISVGNLLLTIPKSIFPPFGGAIRVVQTGQIVNFVPILGIFLSALQYMRYAATTKSISKRKKHTLKATEQVLALTGVPLGAANRSRKFIRSIILDISEGVEPFMPGSRSEVKDFDNTQKELFKDINDIKLDLNLIDLDIDLDFEL